MKSKIAQKIYLKIVYPYYDLVEYSETTTRRVRHVPVPILLEKHGFSKSQIANIPVSSSTRHSQYFYCDTCRGHSFFRCLDHTEFDPEDLGRKETFVTEKIHAKKFNQLLYIRATDLPVSTLLKNKLRRMMPKIPKLRRSNTLWGEDLEEASVEDL